MNMILILICLILAVPQAHADFVVLYDKATGEAVNFSSSDSDFNIDVDQKSGYDTVKINGDVKQYIEQNPISDYKISNKSLVLNVRKINDRVASDVDVQEKSAEYNLVYKKSQQTAYETLVLNGVVFKYITADTFK